jgi:hypothetical protein
VSVPPSVVSEPSPSPQATASMASTTNSTSVFVHDFLVTNDSSLGFPFRVSGAAHCREACDPPDGCESYRSLPIRQTFTSRLATGPRLAYIPSFHSSSCRFLASLMTLVRSQPEEVTPRQSPANARSIADGEKISSITMAAAPVMPALSSRDEPVINRSVVLSVVER